MPSSDAVTSQRASLCHATAVTLPECESRDATFGSQYEANVSDE